VKRPADLECRRDFAVKYYAHLPAQLQEEIKEPQLSGYNFFITGETFAHMCAKSAAQGANNPSERRLYGA